MRNGNARFRRRGAALIVVLGVLAILALLATTFATLQRVERQTARNYLDLVRSRLLARSGIDYGMVRIREFFPTRSIDSSEYARSYRYFGDDLTETQARPEVPLHQAKNPSFALEDEPLQDPTDANFAPRQVTVEGEGLGVTGVMSSGTYARNGDQYVLRVDDASGFIHINDGLENGKDGSVSQNTRRILNVLGDIIQVPGMGDKIIDARPPQGYITLAELDKVFDYDAAVLRKIRPYLAVHAWQDDSVVNPVPLSGAVLSEYPVTYERGSPPRYRFNRELDCNGDEWEPALDQKRTWLKEGGDMYDPLARVYGLDSLNPQYVELVKRAPVHINAAPKEVLSALLTGLKGHFLMDRRRSNPPHLGYGMRENPWGSKMLYDFLTTHVNFRPEGVGRYKVVNGVITPYAAAGEGGYGVEGDELGYLFCTNEIQAPLTGTGAKNPDLVYADDIAEHMVAFRERRATQGVTPAFDYSGVTWAGDFNNWSQFNRFCDHLVEIGVFKDNRDIFFDHLGYNDVRYDSARYNSGARFGFSPDNVADSPLQRMQAVRAMADVLKANFNPNLHLNELNPDENLFQIVDKTDLIVNSTEFCLHPTGYVRIESLGRVLSPMDGADDVFTAADNRVLSESKVVAVMRVFERVRQTSQKDFYAGELPLAVGTVTTNNARALEIGPEPDNGSAPSETEWDGYVQFATVGPGTGGNVKPKGALWRTIGDVASDHCWDSAICVHYGLDADAHGHKLGTREELASNTVSHEFVYNYPDVGETLPGPYDPTDGDYRLLHAFRLDAGGGTVSLPVPSAPMDLRMDGLFSERHSGPAYAASQGYTNDVFDYSAGDSQGTVEFWLKPFFQPELTGKIRYFFDHSRYHGNCDTIQQVHVTPFFAMFSPAHHVMDQGDVEYVNEFNTLSYMAPASVLWGSEGWHELFVLDELGNRLDPKVTDLVLGGNAKFGGSTFALNQRGHESEIPAADQRPDLLVAHRWIHMGFNFKTFDGGVDDEAEIYINGLNHVRTPYAGIKGGVGCRAGRYYFGHTTLAGARPGEDNHFRFGSCSKIGNSPVIDPGVVDAYRGNHTADATIDEIYVWDFVNDVSSMRSWSLGRYYKPLASAEERTFVSAPIQLRTRPFRSLAPPTAATPTGGFVPPPTDAVTSSDDQIRVLGASWTWYGGGYDADWNRILRDWDVLISSDDPRTCPVDLQLWLDVDGVEYGPLTNDMYSEISQRGVLVPEGGEFRYKARFELDPSNIPWFDASTISHSDLISTSILLDSPVLDDVTIFYTIGYPEILEYWLDLRQVGV